MGNYKGKYVFDYFDLQQSLIETLQMMEQAAQADEKVKDADFLNMQLYLAGMVASLGNIAGSFDEASVEKQMMSISALQNMNLMASFGDAYSQIDSYLQNHESMKNVFSRLQANIATIHNPDGGEMSLANKWNDELDDFRSTVYSNVIAMRKTGLEYQKKIDEIQNAKKEYYVKKAGKEAMAQIGDDYKKEYDKARIYAKDRFAQIVEEYKKNPNADDTLLQILSKLEAYTKLEATGANGSLFRKEKEMLINAADKLVGYVNKINKNADVVKSISEERAAEERIRMAENLRHMIVDITNGSLVVPQEKDFDGNVIEPKNHFMNTHDTRFKGAVFNNGYAGDPLFPHDPCPEDIQQGWIGNCYLVAGLANLAKNNPQAIKDMMVDNGDGTVTVRFWGRPAFDAENPNLNREKEPIYVTVDKISPRYCSAYNSLWVNMIERAYVASGMHLANDVSGDFMPKDMKAEYERISKLKPEDRPSHIECPWLISESGELKEWKPSYNQIVGGDTSRFLSHVLGDESKNISISINRIRRDNNFDSLMHGLVDEDLGSKILIDAMKDLLPPPGMTKELEKVIAKQNAPAAMKMMLVCTGGSLADIEETEESLDGTDIYNTLFNGDANIVSNNDNLSAEDLFLPHIQRIRQAINSGDQSYIQFGNERLAYQKHDNAKMLKENTIKQIDEYEAKLRKGQEGLKEEDRIEYEKNKVKLVEYENSAAQYEKEYKALKSTGDEKRRKYKEFVENLCSNIEVSIDKIYGKRYTGRYDRSEKQVYNILKKSLEAGATVNCSTQSDDNEISVNGLVGNHAYTVAGLVEDKSKNPPLYYVRVRNPHGDGCTGVEYIKNDNGKITGTKAVGVDCGYMDLELSDFTKSMDTIFFNGKDVPKEVESVASAEYKEKAELSNPGIMDVQTYKEYFNAFAVLKSNIKSSHGLFTRDSSEFKSFDKIMKKMSPISGIGLPVKGCAGAYEDLKLAANKYIRYCGENHKSGSRRALREYSAKATVSLLTLMESGEKRPVEATHKLIAKKLLQNEAEKYQKQGKTAAAQKITRNLDDLVNDMMTKDAGFKKYIRNQSFTDLLVLSDLDGKTISDAFKKAKTEIKTDHLEMQEENPVNQKMEGAPAKAN